MALLGRWYVTMHLLNHIQRRLFHRALSYTTAVCQQPNRKARSWSPHASVTHAWREAKLQLRYHHTMRNPGV